MDGQAFPHGKRLPLLHPSWAAQRKPFLTALFMAALMLQCLFLGVMSYLFGAAFLQGDRLGALNILAVDFDGGAIGQGLKNAYLELKSSETFLTLDFASATSFPTTADVKNAVCKGNYWGAVYTHSGASDRLWASVQGESSTYDATDTITYTFNEVRYAAIADGTLRSNLETLVGAARTFYYQTSNGSAALQTLNRSDSTAVEAFLNPIESSNDIIMPTTQGTRVFLNTVAMVMPVLAQFFYQMALNGVSGQFGVLAKARFTDLWLFRLGVGKLYTLLAGLVMTGYFWAFRETWSVNGGQFMLTWMILWLYMDVSWMIVDTILATFIPMQFFPYFMLSWVLINVASSVFPFELSAGFYRVGYVLPAHETYSMLVLIWSGCADQKDVALPVLFAWWVLGHVGSVFSLKKRCAMAEAEAAARASEPQVQGQGQGETNGKTMSENNKADDIEMGDLSMDRDRDRTLISGTAENDEQTIIGDPSMLASQVDLVDDGSFPSTNKSGQASTME